MPKASFISQAEGSGVGCEWISSAELDWASYFDVPIWRTSVGSSTSDPVDPPLRTQSQASLSQPEHGVHTTPLSMPCDHSCMRCLRPAFGVASCL
eukprot:11336621-Alexandrium_andersonii.AAC.1